MTSRDGGATWSDGGVPMGTAMTSAAFVGGNTLMIGGHWGPMTRDLTSAPLS